MGRSPSWSFSTTSKEEEGEEQKANRKDIKASSREHNQRWHEKGIVKMSKARSNKSKSSESGHRAEGGETTPTLLPALTE